MDLVLLCSYAITWLQWCLHCVTVLKRAFDAFAAGKGYIEATMVGTILSMLGHDVSEKQLKSIIEEVDADGESYIYIDIN